MRKQTVCLNMIVRNEAHVIQRSLGTLLPLFDYWIIVDTGSSDETRSVINEFLKHVPGELHERPWVNFGHNRSEALALARGKADYVLFFDADDILHADADFRLPQLTADAYHARHTQGTMEYQRILLVKDGLPWRYEGVIHCYATPDQPFTSGNLEGLSVESRRDGARGAMDPRAKYLRNARTLEEDLSRNPGNPRSAFYLAMSYRDAGESEKALEAYSRRIAMGGWEEEVWYSKLEIARLQEAAGHDFHTVVSSYIDAQCFRPTRAEAFGLLASYCRRNGAHWFLARAFASEGMKLPKPADQLFIDASWYLWRCKDEFAIASYWLGDLGAARTANLELLSSEHTPESARARIVQNLDFCLKALGAPRYNPDRVSAPGRELRVWMHPTEQGQLLAVLHTLAPRTVIEWGVGGSTQLILRNCPSIQRYVAIEHDPGWVDKVRDAIQDSRLELLHVRADQPPLDNDLRNPATRDWARKAEFDESIMHTYVATAEKHVDEADLVFVDGRARRFCIEAGYALLRPGGVLVLHDAQRSDYLDVLERLGHTRFLEPWSQGQLCVLRKPDQ